MRVWWLGLLLLAACAAPAFPSPPQPPPEHAWRKDGVWWCYYERGILKWCETDDPRAVPRLSY